MDPVSFLFKCATYAAGNRLREIRKSRERAEVDRIAALEKALQKRVAAQEKAREDRDPVYRAMKVAQRAEEAAQREQEAVRRVAQGVAYVREQTLRRVQRWMFWLGFVCFVLTILGTPASLDADPFAWGWAGFGVIWLYLCCVPKHFL